MLEALRIRDFRLVWTGQLVNAFGSWLLAIAIPAHVLQVTGSLRDTGLTVAAEYLPLLLLGPLAGVIADRCDRRRLMIAANLLSAAAVMVMLAGSGPGRYAVLYAALIAESSGSVLYGPAAQARIPAIVGTGPMLSSANALSSASGGTVRLIGGPLGGFLLTQVGLTWLIAADAVSYLLSALANAATSRSANAATSRSASAVTSPSASAVTSPSPTSAPPRRARLADVSRDLAEGTRALRRLPAARALFPVTVVFLAANASLSAILIPLGVQRLGGSEHTGFLLSALGAGYLAGAPLIRWLLDRVQPGRLLAATLALTAMAFFALFTSSSLAQALPAAVAVGVFGSMSLVIPQTILQRVVPGAVLGRVGAVFLTAEAATTLLGAAAGPFLAQATGLAGAATAASLACLAAAALALLTVPHLPVPPLAVPPLAGPGPGPARH